MIMVVIMATMMMITIMKSDPKKNSKQDQKQFIHPSASPVDEEDSEVILCALACENRKS